VTIYDAKDKPGGALRYLIPDIDQMQQLRGAVPYVAADSAREPLNALLDPSPIHSPEFEAWVKDALSHYWGGPKLTHSPLMRLRVVSETLDHADDDPTRALRLVLGQALGARVRADDEEIEFQFLPSQSGHDALAAYRHAALVGRVALGDPEEADGPGVFHGLTSRRR
jgi:hypothetical protein